MLCPKFIEEAISYIAQGNTVLLAGGTYVLARPERRREHLLNLGELSLEYILERADCLHYGAMMRIEDLTDQAVAPLAVRELLSDAVRASKPSWLLRNMSTIGGEIVERDAHSLIPLALLALNAKVKLAYARGITIVDIDEFYSSYSNSNAASPFILVEVLIPRPRLNSRLLLRRIGQLPSQGTLLAAAIQMIVNGKAIQQARVALGGAGLAHRRLYRLEEALCSHGNIAKSHSLQDIFQAGVDGLVFEETDEAPKSYFRDIARVLLYRCCNELLNVAG